MCRTSNGTRAVCRQSERLATRRAEETHPQRAMTAWPHTCTITGAAIAGDTVRTDLRCERRARMRHTRGLRHGRLSAIQSATTVSTRMSARTVAGKANEPEACMSDRTADGKEAPTRHGRRTSAATTTARAMPTRSTVRCELEMTAGGKQHGAMGGWETPRARVMCHVMSHVSHHTSEPEKRDVTDVT